ncbi:MAG: purine/pyrimidine permease [Deltaproteobacteria bacterium]|nr:purine/pyrimidine permease [Deltaproteobacteria bacterium]
MTMEFKYGLEDRPPLAEALLFALQWFAVTVPLIVIMGRIVAGFHENDPAGQILYLQKLTFVVAVTLACEIWWGHRLPIVAGPSSILLIGVLASRGFDAATVYTAVACGGALLTLASLTGIFTLLQRLFTPRIIAVILILIAFTLAPKIMEMVTLGDGNAPPIANLSFALVLTFGMFWLNRQLGGIWKSTLILWVMGLGSLLYQLWVPAAQVTAAAAPPWFASLFTNLTTHPRFDPGVLISFLICFLALSINDLGAIQSVNALLSPPEPKRRLICGMAITGLANVFSGFLGVLGPVNYTLSPGILAATSCASRRIFIPTAFLLLLLSLSPWAVGIAGKVPSVIVGSILLYVLTSQVAVGFMTALEAGGPFGLTEGTVVGGPVLIGAVIAFLPAPIFATIPVTLQPILGNGFVVGMIAALILEHVIFKVEKEG